MTVTILHVITTLGRGGAERQLVNLVRNTQGEEFSHTICYLHSPDDFVAELKAAGADVICLNLPQKWPWLFAPARLVPLLRGRRPQLIQTWLFEADVSARLSTLFGPSIPIINTLHLTTYDAETIRAAGWSTSKLAALKEVDRWTARAVRPLFVAVSEAVKRSAVCNLGVSAEEVRVIYNSIDQSTLRCDTESRRCLRMAAEIPADAFVYVNVGRLAPQKGQSVLLRAFKEVTAMPDVYLVLVGEGPQEAALKTLTQELQLESRVRFLGRRADVGACLQMADAFVFPSLFEGFPLAPIEAMLQGLPCVVARIDPVLELFEDGVTGLLVAPGCVEELSAAMIQLYRRPELRQQLGARARAAATEKFDSERGLDAWAQLYREFAHQ